MFLEAIFVVVTIALAWKLLRPHTSLGRRQRDPLSDDSVGNEHDRGPVHSIRR